MIRKAYCVGFASILLASAFLTGCSSTTATPPATQIVTVTAMGPYAWNTTLNTAFSTTVPFSVIVTTASAAGGPGTPVAGVVVTFTAPLSGAGGTFSNGTNSTTATTDANGVATSSTLTTPTPPATPILSNPFTANGTPGTYLVVASAESTQSTALFNMSNTWTPVTTVASPLAPQSAAVGLEFATALSVTVTDGSTPPNPVSGIPVTFAAPAPGANIATGYFIDTDSNTTTATTNSSGVATAALLVAGSVPGVYTVTATPAGGAVADFTVSNTKAPVAITPVAGSTPQTATVSTDFANPLAVIVTGAAGAPVVGAAVTFTAPAQPAAPAAPVPSGDFYDTTVVPPAYDLLSVTVTTDATGTATAPAFQANAVASPVGPPVVTYNVTATVVIANGSTLSTNFVLTNQ